ncbi:MAG: sulfatase-like hydrolase/transferase [Persicimonas sp.]
MKHLLNGARAGVIAALLLTLWSFLGADEAMGDASEATGIYYVLSAFGLLGLPQVIYGLAVGAVAGGWARLFEKRDRLFNRTDDQRLAAILLTAPVLAVLVGAGVGALHLAVTSSFVRTSFQAMGLTAGAVVLVGAAFVAAPLIYAPLAALFTRLFPVGEDDESAVPRSTLTVLGIYAIVAVGGAIVAYQYAVELQVWDTSLLQMAIAGVAATPALFLLMWKLDVARIAWRVGVPIAGALAAVVCFFGAFGWTSSSSEMRQATTRSSTLLAKTTQALQPLADRDGDGYASGLGGIDCDDTDPDVYPGAKEIPGNGVDENCSGEDAPPPSAEDHPSRKIVSRAIDSGRNAATKEAENIPDPPPNVVFILVDTLRQDHLGYAGYERDTSPNIDRLADEGVAFMDTYAPSPHTPRSIPPLFFSRYPSRMNFYRPTWNYPKILDDNLSVFEVLDDHGRRNVGVTSHFYFEEDQGIRQGFDDWKNEGAGSISESNDDIAAPRVWKQAEPTIEQLAERWRQDQEPFSLFVHLFEPHARWIGHDDYDFGRGSTQRERHINNYDSEIAFADAYVGRIIDKLEQEGIYDEVVVVLTSDHGEGFNEHGHYFHGQTLYNEVIKIPMIIRVPGWFGRKVDGAVSLLDVAPTLLELFGISIPTDFEGESLVEAMLGRSGVPDRPVFAELLPYTNWKEKHQAIIDGDDKFILVVTSGVEQLFDLAEDPGEQDDLSGEHPERAAELKSKINKFMQGQ